MAEMIPDRLPHRASAGEKKLFVVLQRLPDDYIVYYEPMVENRYPDFIIICPDIGLLVIEVKGWYPRDIIAADTNTVIVKELREQVRRNHPVKQAREYMLSIMDECRRHCAGRRLLQVDGEFSNRFIFPFGHFAILSNITSTQLMAIGDGYIIRIFPPEKVATRDILESWDNDSIAGYDLSSILKNYFDPIWPIKRLGASQIDTLRAVIHPEIIITTQTPLISSQLPENKEDNFQDIKVLDLKQENHARKIGEGHRIVYGVAGSGKTVLLIAKARLLSSQKSNDFILVLCFNVVFATYLKQALNDCANVTVLHFDAWAKNSQVTRKREESSESLGERLLRELIKGTSETRKYDAVMVDEAQDFEPSWFKCIIEALKEPNDGDLIIVGDSSQGLYPHGKISWKAIGIHAQGRAISTKFNLDQNYRNSREIIDLAAIFSSKSETDTEDTLIAVTVDPIKTIRKTGIMPCLVISDNQSDEINKIIVIVKQLLDGKWRGKPIEPFQPMEIAILYPFATKRQKGMLHTLLKDLNSLTKAIWLTDPENSNARNRVNEQGIKIQTIQSAKGLQYRAVIILWADTLPMQFGNSTIEDNRRLFYVALTRPEDYLIISASGPSVFIAEIEKSGKIDTI